MNIFEKLNKIKVDNQKKISDADQALIAEHEAVYLEQFAKFTKMYTSLCADLNSEGIFEIPNNKYNTPSGKTKTSPYINYLRARIVGILENMKDLTQNFSSGITKYFKSKYGVSLTDLSYGDLPVLASLDAKDVVAHIVNQLGGLTFGEKEKEELFEGFYRIVGTHRNWGRQPSLKKSKTGNYHKAIKFPHLLYWDTRYSWSDSHKLTYSSYEYVPVLGKVFSYFETGELENVIPSFNDGNTFVFKNLPAEIPLPGSFTKIEKIKVFENGNLDIVFRTGAVAAEFYRSILLLDPETNTKV